MVGRGPYVGDDIILTWEIEEFQAHPIEALAFFTTGYDGIWEFSDMPGKIS